MPPKVAKITKDLPELTNDCNYVDWRKDVKVWKLVNKDADHTKFGGLLYLSLKGKAREYVRDISEDDLGKDDGFDIVLKKLDEIYLQEKDTRAFLAVEEFISYKRKDGVSMTDFIAHYDYLYGKLSEFDMKLPEGFQAFFLLNASNLSEDHKKLARATCPTLTYKNMKENILKIFGDLSLSSNSKTSEFSLDNSSAGAINIKSEPVYMADNEDNVLYARNNYRSSGYAGNYSNSGYNGPHSSNSGYSGYHGPHSSRGGKYGGNKFRNKNKRLCYKCESPDHVVSRCPILQAERNQKKKNSNSVHITLFNSVHDPKLLDFVRECFGKALLDCGCNKTVMGRLWFEAFLTMLTDEEIANIKYDNAENIFRFGDSPQVVSSQVVHLPVSFGGKNVLIQTCLVDNNIPLLLSRQSMADAGVLLNFQTGQAKVFGQWHNLDRTESGHYLVPLTKIMSYKQENITLHATSGLTDEELNRKAVKLHRVIALKRIWFGW